MLNLDKISTETNSQTTSKESFEEKPIITDAFVNRHLGINEQTQEQMLKYLGVSSIDELIAKTIPSDIRLEKPLNLPPAKSEYEALKYLKTIASQNQVFRSYIGMGYHDCITPGVIQRNILENPGWYTSYTPYQA